MVGALAFAVADGLLLSLLVSILEDIGGSQLTKSDTVCDGSLVVLLEEVGSLGGVELRVEDVQLVVALVTATFTARLELEV